MAEQYSGWNAAPVRTRCVSLGVSQSVDMARCGSNLSPFSKLLRSPTLVQSSQDGPLNRVLGGRERIDLLHAPDGGIHFESWVAILMRRLSHQYPSTSKTRRYFMKSRTSLVGCGKETCRFVPQKTVRSRVSRDHIVSNLVWHLLPPYPSTCLVASGAGTERLTPSIGPIQACTCGRIIAEEKRLGPQALPARLVPWSGKGHLQNLALVNRWHVSGR